MFHHLWHVQLQLPLCSKPHVKCALTKLAIKANHISWIFINPFEIIHHMYGNPIFFHGYQTRWPQLIRIPFLVFSQSLSIFVAQVAFPNLGKFSNNFFIMFNDGFGEVGSKNLKVIIFQNFEDVLSYALEFALTHDWCYWKVMT